MRASVFLVCCLISAWIAPIAHGQDPDHTAEIPQLAASDLPYHKAFAHLPTFSSQESHALLSFTRSLELPKSSALVTAILEKSRAALQAFKEDSSSYRSRISELHWNVDRPFHADTPRPHIPKLELLCRVALLDAANEFHLQRWDAAWAHLQDVHVAARVLNRDPNLFAQLGSQSMESNALRLSARYCFLSPKPSYQAAKERRLALPPLDSGRAALKHQYQVHLFQIGEVFALPATVRDADSLVSLLRSFQANADPQDPHHEALKQQIERLIQHTTELQNMYEQLEAGWQRPYPEALERITMLYQDALKRQQIHYSSTFPYAPFYRKCQEVKTYEALLEAGEQLTQRQDRSDTRGLPLDPRFQQAFEVEIHPTSPATLELRSSGTKNEVLRVSVLLEQF